MNFSSFLYRRLSRWITCEFLLWGNARIALQSKYEVASFQDVFCNPFYWQVFQTLQRPPSLVVDCGAHCGHFTILAEQCIRARFGSTETRYILIEPNPALIPIIHKNMSDAGLSERAEVLTGLLGRKSGQSTLWVFNKNYLEASTSPMKNARPYKVDYIDLEKKLAGRAVDLMKIDIEGGEFEFVQSQPGLFSSAQTLFMEIHEADPQLHQQLYDSLREVKLVPIADAIKSVNHELLIFQQAAGR